VRLATAHVKIVIDNRFIEQGMIGADRRAVAEWIKGEPSPWIVVMEATIFTGGILGFLRPHAVDLKETRQC